MQCSDAWAEQRFDPTNDCGERSCALKITRCQQLVGSHRCPDRRIRLVPLDVLLAQAQSSHSEFFVT